VDLYQHNGTSWVLCKNPYVKRSGVWVRSDEAYVKRSGIWVQSFDYDDVPPDPPELTLNIVDDVATVNGKSTLQYRYITVGVRAAAAQDVPDLKLIRVLTTYNGAAPTTPLGGTYISEPDQTWPAEPWSDWKYNQWGPHKDTSVMAYKEWPRNASTSSNPIASDKDYFFTAWAQDDHGLWSAATALKVHTPKATTEAANIIVKEATFSPNASGTWRADGFHWGQLMQQYNKPYATGLWFYGNQITDSVGRQTSTGEYVTVRQAQIYIQRMNDNGQANANVYLYWTTYGTVPSLPSAGSALVKNETTKLGTLAKGQGKWFTLPASFTNNLNRNIVGMGLDLKDPVKAAGFPEDFSVVEATANVARCGELHLVWEEEL
jgi:hypothetical protein